VKVYDKGAKDTGKMKRCVRCGSAAGEAEMCTACREFFRELGRAVGEASPQRRIEHRVYGN
jgi:ribosomal protein S14